MRRHHNCTLERRKIFLIHTRWILIRLHNPVCVIHPSGRFYAQQKTKNTNTKKTNYQPKFKEPATAPDRLPPVYVHYCADIHFCVWILRRIDPYSGYVFLITTTSNTHTRHDLSRPRMHRLIMYDTRSYASLYACAMCRHRNCTHRR